MIFEAVGPMLPGKRYGTIRGLRPPLNENSSRVCAPPKVEF